MKIKHRILLSFVVTFGLIILSLAFASHDINAVVAKVRFVEIADDLRASFLEMRLAEKNYFLFNDTAALAESVARSRDIEQTLRLVGPEIESGIGKENLGRLREYFAAYAKSAEEISTSGSRSPQDEKALREAGFRLRSFSDKMTSMERENVHRIIATSRQGMFASLIAVMCVAFLAGPLLFLKMLSSLKRVEAVANAISVGQFMRIDGPIPDDELGSVMQAINTMSTQIRSREKELIQSEKLASLGTLIAGVAHEISNPLNNISMIVETYETLYDDMPKTQGLEFLHKISNELERIRQVVLGLLNFSKPEKAQRRAVHLNEIVTLTLRLVQNMLDVSNIHLELHLTQGLPPVTVSLNQMQQVLVNLITNAIQAMDHGGSLYITTWPGTQPGFQMVEIRDTGKGIAQEHLSQLFDPFFSTKGVDGTGLGLSVSYSIIRDHGGSIRAANHPQGGAVFTIELPDSGQAAKE